jgi:putative pyrroloquinoline-quinone binding quinoprotein
MRAPACRVAVASLCLALAASACSGSSHSVRAGAGHPSPSARPSGPPPVFQGQLLIADRGNNRLLVVDAAKHVLWRYPNRNAPAPPGGFYFPDDAFFVHGGRAVISNQEGNNTVVQIAFPSGRLLWSYGHPKRPGSAAGFLHEPDDAYLLRNGEVAVADANNCRIVLISSSARQIGQIGTTGDCVHSPPKSLGYPNGDTPLRDGNLLVSEVHGSWISEYTPQGRLVWTVQLPQVTYPSDPQQIGPDRYLVADYARPGGLYEFNRAGRILWSYRPHRGHRMLDHPSLAEVLPNGLIATNDDYRDRVVIIDPATKRIVWQYGHDDRGRRTRGYLNTPDGFDLLLADGSTPTHPFTG